MAQINETAYPVDESAFQDWIAQYRHELLVHCYRILGSMDDAEDALQETWLRAWRRLSSLKERAALRAWLYKIATNVSLDMLDHRKSRALPATLFPSADPDEMLPDPIADPIWLDPMPDTLLDGLPANPEARYETRESITLAFLAVLQKLPPRQRAILLLRDVLGWKTQEVANLLEVTTVAVNSTLQRARETMKREYDKPGVHILVRPENAETANLLSRYVQAWEAADSGTLITLLRDDAVLTMPPFPTWFRGTTAIQSFLDQLLFTQATPGVFRMAATRANGSPAFAVYQRDNLGVYRPTALQILTIADDRIAQIDDFIALDDRLFSQFGLPLTG
jgi:RNA polymerase sigma-70 factor (ECF subfamily)